MVISAHDTRAVLTEMKEELDLPSLDIEGAVPLWLEGSLVRNGPVNVVIGEKTNGHWFDGLAMLHLFSFHKGKVGYKNRFLRTHSYEKVFAEKSLDYDGFAVDPCRSLFKRLFTLFTPVSPSYLHNANVNVAKIANRYVALTETPLPVAFDVDTLETLGVLDYEDQLPKKGCWESAHPHCFSAEKYSLNYLIEYGRKSKYVIYQVEQESAVREVVATIPVENPSYMHSFAVTENYVILTAFPFTVHPLHLLVNFYLKGKPFIKNFTWHPEEGTHFLVVNRHTGEWVGDYRTKPFFAFHHVNAFEKDDSIYLDLVCYDHPGIIDELGTYFRKNAFVDVIDENCYLTRLERFCLSKGEISAECILKEAVEFPRINETRDGKFYRYAYLVNGKPPLSNEDLRPLYKVELETKQVWQWAEKGCYPGEPVFIARPDGVNEDEGVILSIVLDPKNGSSFLLVLDAETFRELARARVEQKIPVGLHGRYFPL